MKALSGFVSATATRVKLAKEDGEEFTPLKARMKVMSSIYSQLTDEEKNKVLKKMSSDEKSLLGIK